MKVRVELDYPDELIEKYGVQDAADTLAARLDEVYPGPSDAGEVLNPPSLDVIVGDTVNARVFSYGGRQNDMAVPSRDAQEAQR